MNQTRSDSSRFWDVFSSDVVKEAREKEAAAVREKNDE